MSVCLSTYTVLCELRLLQEPQLLLRQLALLVIGTLANRHTADTFLLAITSK